MKTFNSKYFLNTLNIAIEKDVNENQINFSLDESNNILDIFWFEDCDNQDNDFHLELDITYTEINDENGYTVDLDAMSVRKLSYGDTYNNEEVLVDDLDKEYLAKLIEKLFDKHNENKGDYETGYAINLIK